MKHALLICATFLAGAGALRAADGDLLASTASPSPTFTVYTVADATYVVADAAEAAALPRVTWFAGETVTATSCGGGSSTLASAAATAGSAAFTPNAGGVWTLANSAQGTARVGVPWTVFDDGGLLDAGAVSPAFRADSRQPGPDRRVSQRDALPVAYTGDNWARNASAASTLTLAPPTGAATALTRAGTDAESFRFTPPGIWHVTLAMANGKTLSATLDILGDGTFFFVQ